MKERKEIGFVSIYVGILKYRQILQEKWKLIFAISFFAGLLGVLYAWSVPKTYIAELTFAIEDKSPSGIYSSIANQFGIDLGKDAGGAYKGDNIIELFKSRSMVEKALLSPVNIGSQKKLLVDYYCELNTIPLKELGLNFNRPREEFSRAEDSLLQIISYSFIRSNLDVDKADKKSAFIKYSFRSGDELFAKVFLETLANAIKESYLAQKTNKIRASIAILEFRLDSVKKELDTEMSGAASVQDQNQNASVARVRVPYQKKQMNIQLLTTLYGELVKSMEMSKMSLVREEPLIETIDGPRFPLKFEKKSRLITGLVFSFIAGFLTVLFIVGSVMYKEFQQEVMIEKAKNND